MISTMKWIGRSSLQGVVLLLLLFLSSDLIAQEGDLPTVEKWRLGGHLAFGLLDYDASMSGLPEVPSCCPGYEDGSGTSLGVGFAYELPIAEPLSISSRLLFGRSSGMLEADELELVTRGTDTVRATFHHTIEASRPTILLEEMLLYHPIERFSIMGGIGLDLAVGGSYKQDEEIAAPDDIRYGDDTRRRLVYDGSIPNESTLAFSLLGGIRYDIPVNEEGTFILSPELLYWHGLSNLVNDITWKMRGIRLGVTMSWIKLGAGESPSPLGP